MSDQAQKLREMINNLKNRPLVSRSVSEEQEKRRCRVLTITSGKGGVGKTNISVNLALNLSQLGYRVIILDADFGLANIDILFGVSPNYTLLDVVNDSKTIFDIITEGPMNVKFISGGSGLEEMVHLEKQQLGALIEKIESLDQIADIVIIDTGAGISDNVISFTLASDEIILVTTPEPTSIMDAYALIKTVSNKDKEKDIQLIVNRAESEKEAMMTMKKLSFASENFLGMKLQHLGYLLYDINVVKAIKQQEPFMISYPKSNASKQIYEIACKLMQTDSSKLRKSTGIKAFFRRLVNLDNA
ncbi:MinD/ParA family protein [Petroclostridium sp. X23]|uniref:MinD/ParA family protein n=1 Tax=Petroclostridium sp. X23 TaxID=3045146 RepID=UPI0024AD6BD0|nr:MinD/ParA family protein [Petroclostridium sp. X23]WHH58954.1 MinD/ParA family protein [Petroclostridium sp. X23]